MQILDEDHLMGAAHLICNLRHKNTNEIPEVLQNESDYDYRLIIKKLAEKYKRQLECLG